MLTLMLLVDVIGANQSNLRTHEMWRYEPVQICTRILYYLDRVWSIKLKRSNMHESIKMVLTILSFIDQFRSHQKKVEKWR